ncbi:MAG: hypothetical protein OXH36_02720 [Bdellovibrionales bacterium]|nr:hypothetical protein [Bdellovibrionales bacterium]
MRKKMDFQILETITNNQTNIYNQLLLYCAEKTARKKSNPEDKRRRRSQFNSCKKSIMPDFNYSIDFQELVSRWWADEIKWYKKNQDYGQIYTIYALLYRSLLLFFKNSSSCPFMVQTKKGNKIDKKEFCIENQKLFKKFLNQSIKIIPSQRKFQPIIDILPFLKNLKKIDINEQIYSATHKLYGQDWNIVKGVVVGGGTGVVASIFLGPIIGGYIGNLAGLYGAAATSYGLAFLGGGSLAAGGFGMVGGSFVLGLGFGLTNGVRCGVKNAPIDELNKMQAQILLPLLLGIGRLLFENGNTEIPALIHKTLSKRLTEFEKRLQKFENKYDKLLEAFDDEKEIKNIEQSITSVEKTISLYDKATDMSASYDWCSGYDIFKEVKAWAS